MDDDLVDDVINDLQRGRLYRPDRHPVSSRSGRVAPRHAVIEVYAAAVRHLKSPSLGDLLADWDIRWAGLSTWRYGFWRFGLVLWMLALRIPLLAAAVLVAAFKPAVITLAPASGLPWVGTLAHPVIVTSRWATMVLLAATALVLLGLPLVGGLPGLRRAPLVVGDLVVAVGFVWLLGLLVLTVVTPASWLDLRELGTSWCRYLPVIAVLASALALSTHTPARRFLPASVVTVLAAGAIGLGWFWPGWSPERGPISHWVALAAVTLLICLALGVWRHQERLMRQVARRVPHLQASPALIERLHQVVRFERRDAPPPGYDTAPAHDRPPHRFTMTMSEPDRLSVGYQGKRESRPTSQTPSFLWPRPPDATPQALNGRSTSSRRVPLFIESWFVDQDHAVLDAVWLCDEGDAVREGDPIAVTATIDRRRFYRRYQHYRLRWSFAPCDGVVTQLTPAATKHNGIGARALIQPTTGFYPPLHAEPGTTPAHEAPTTI